MYTAGLLLDDDFSKVYPFSEWIRHGGQHWGVPKCVDFCDESLSFCDKYRLLFHFKGRQGDCVHQSLVRDSEYLHLHIFSFSLK